MTRFLLIHLFVFIFNVGKAQTFWYRVDDPESKTCFFIDTFGNKSKIGIHQKLDIAHKFTDGLICVNFKRAKDIYPLWGCLNENGDTIIHGLYPEPFYFYNGVARVFILQKPTPVSLEEDEPNYLCKYINTKGIAINEKVFEGNSSFDMVNHWTVTKAGSQWYILSKLGKLKTLSVDYAAVEPFSDGMARCKRMNTYTVYVDTTSWPVFDIPNENYYGDFYNGFASYSNVKDKYGFIDKKGRPISSCIYDEVAYFSEDMGAVKIYNKWGFIDSKGKMLIKAEYDVVDAFCEGLAKVGKNGKFGFINKLGQLVIPLKFNDVQSFSNLGLAPASNEANLWGFINRKGEWVFKPQFIEASNFDKNGFTTVFYTDKNSYKKGKLESYEKALISIHKKVVWYSGEKLIFK
jgi:hypothetical protein